MSLDTLRGNLVAEAAGGQIRINANTFVKASLQAPAGLDDLLKQTFVDIDVSQGLPIATAESQIGPIQDSAFYVDGTINVRIAKNKSVRIRFAASGSQGALVIGIQLTNSWRFGNSFVSLTGKTFAGIAAKDPYFFFAGQIEPAYPWSSTTVALARGLNFAGYVSLDGYLAVVLKLIPGLTPEPVYVLSGTVDPSKEVQEKDGKKIYGFPGLKLTSTPLSTGSFVIGYLTIQSPYLSIAIHEMSDDLGLTPVVMVSAALQIPGSGPSPEFQAQIPVSEKTKIAAFTIADPKGGLALTADQVFALMAGETWFGLVPPALSSFLQSFGFRSFGVVINYGKTFRIANVEVVIASGTPWRVWADPLLEFTFELDWTIQAPFQTGQSHYAVLSATAKFMPELFPGDFLFSIDSDMVVSGAYAAADPSQYVSFNKLVSAITGGFIKIPEQFVTIEFQEFFATVNQPSRSFSFGATTSVKFPILGEGNFELNNVAIRLNVQRPQDAGGQALSVQPRALTAAAAAVDAAGTVYTGSIRGDLIVGPLYLTVGAAYADETWTFDLAMQPGTELRFQDLIKAVFQDVQLPTDIFNIDVQISAVVLKAVTPSDKNKPTVYSGSGTIRWIFEILSQKIDTTANVALTYNSKATPNKYTGSVTATTTFNIFGIGATFTVGYEIKNEGNQATKILFLSWQGLTATYTQSSGQSTIEFTADNTWNLGRVIKTIVQIVMPSSNRDLPSPWNLLNNISLAGLKVKFDLNTKEVTVSWPLKVNLFFGQIESIDLKKTPGQQVEVSIKGKFLFTDQNDVKWDAVNQDPPEVPGGGDSAFDLRLLALGQHVTVPDLAAINSVNDAVNQLTGFVPPSPNSRVVPIGPGIPKQLLLSSASSTTALAAAEPKPPLFSRDSSWLIGTHFLAVSGMLDLKVIFNDPVLYGLRIALAGAKAKIFAGLEFEILYKKITDSIGMYKIMLKLPDAMRYLQFGTVTVILPIVSIEIYTNGNFKIDFGFPHNMDFSVSFTVQVFPFTGSGGFYFGWLNGATSSQVPKNTPCGNFTPVVEFGLGLQVGLGKSISIAILRAEISVTIFGIIEGVVATWRAYDQSDLRLAAPNGRALASGSPATALAASSGSPDVEKSYYYKITGTIGIIGKIVGVVDFAIIKAEVSLTVYAYIQGTFEAYRKSVVVVEAGVTVKLKFTINFGFFKVTIPLSFSARIKETFVIGSDRLQDAPWYCGGKTASLAAPIVMMRMQAVQRFATAPNFAPLKTPAGGVKDLDVFFLPQLSISGEGAAKADQYAVYSANLFISNEQRTQGNDTYRSFERLMRDTYLWIASSFSGRAQKGTPDEELQQPAALAQMQAAMEYLTANSDGRALSYSAISDNIAALFRLNIATPPATSTSMDDASDGPASTAFAMPPELALKVVYKGAQVADVDFLDWATADDAYLDALQKRINKLIAQMLDELEQQQNEKQAIKSLLRKSAVDKQSLASFVFVDYFAMACQYLIQAAIDTFDTYFYPLQNGDSISKIREQFNTAGNTLTDEQIAWANREHALSGNLNLVISNVPYPIQDGNKWGEIAASHSLQTGALATDNATVQQVLIPNKPLTINQATKNVPNEGSIGATAALFGMTPAQFGDAIATLPDVLQPLTVITLNGLKQTTPASGDPATIVRLAQTYGIEVSALTPSIAGVANLFDSKQDPNLILPKLQALTNSALWADIERNNGIEHLSGMASRYLLSGLRLPVSGIQFKDPNHVCAKQETCGLENLTGQQFRLPSLEKYDPADPLVITLANGRKLPWITFGSSLELPLKVSAEAAAQVEALVKVARQSGLRAPIAPPEPLNVALDRPRQFTFRNNIILQTAAPLPVPFDKLPPNTTPRPLIWNFPVALITELSRPVALDPRFVIQIGSTNTEGGRVIPRAALSYGFGTLINVAIKRVVTTVDGAPVPSTTYELVGADEIGINQLEQLLAVITSTNTAIIDNIYFLYQPNQSTDRAQGLQYDGAQNYTTFLVQANLSSETNPPAAQARTFALEETPPRGLLNSFYQFLSELWSGSIVRSGGYYFFYQLPGGAGLPDSLFNERNIANISVLIVYRAIDGTLDATGGNLKNFVNVAVVNDPIDSSSDVVYVESVSRPASVKLTGDTSLAGVAAAYHLGVVDIAAANASHSLSTSASVFVTDIVHQVARGQTLAQIAQKFKTTEQAIIDQNPHVEFANLTAGTGLHIPDLTTTPAQGTPGLTLPEIATYYDSTPAALAWSNRDVKGLYNPSTPLAFGDLLIDKQSSLPPGNTGLVVTRQNPGEDQTKPEIYLEQQYNMLGYDPIPNTDFIAFVDALALPSTPATDEDQEQVSQPKLAKPLTATAADPWVYTFTVPASRVARNNPIPASTEQSPYPSRDMNPYAGVGGFIQLSLDWRDMLGNHTWSPFDDPSTSNSYPLNDPPTRVGFTDDVIGLSQWPSTHSDHFFDAGPQLVIEWSFDPSRYDKNQPTPAANDDEPAWERNAKADRQVFASAYYQLLQTGREGAPIALETLTSLAGDVPLAITANETSAVRDYVLKAWRYVEKVLANGGDAPPPGDLPTPVHIARAIDPSKIGPITEISVTFQMRRMDPSILADFRDETASRVATMAISPRLVQQNGGYTLDWYTKQFQSAFNGPAVEFRLATGVPRSDLGSGPRRDTLWAVRLGKSAAELYYYRLNNPAMFFAPAPLSTTLISRPDVKLYSFTPEGGLSPSPDIIQSFTGVDLDVWGRTALASIDQLLSPQYAVPAFLVDNKGKTNYLKQVLDTKFKLAGAIVQGVTNILCAPKLDPNGNKANFDAAREKLRQQLLILLENAYDIDAIIQYSIEVTAPASQQGTIAPRLYGNLLDPDQSVTAQDYSASSYKVPLESGSSLLTYAFRARDTRRQSSFRLSLEYPPTHIEHEIAPVPGIEEYKASSWLNFLDRLPSIALAGSAVSPVTRIDVEIPIPLRAYPTPPSLQNQNFFPEPESEDPTTTIERAKKWTFRFIYSQAHAAQDRIDCVVRWNVPPKSSLNARAAEFVDLFTMLARINHVIAQIQAVFEQDLLNIKLDTATSSATFKQAQNALSAFATLTTELDVAWAAWVSQHELNARLFTNSVNEQLPFSISEDFIDKQVETPDGPATLQVLRVTVSYPPNLLPGIPNAPIVTFDGYTPEEVNPEEVSGLTARVHSPAEISRVLSLMSSPDGCDAPVVEVSRKAWIYKKINPQPGEPPYLTSDQALDSPDRRVDIGTLDAIQYQNGWANLRIIRNLNLVEGNLTREPFVYRTPAVQFRNSLTPLLDTSKSINIALVPTGSIEKRTLAEHLTQLFMAFFKGSPSQEQLVKMEVRYSYALAKVTSAPDIELPVLMVPPTSFLIPSNWQKLTASAGPAISADTFIETLAEEIRHWYLTRTPSPQTARFWFDLSAFSSLSNNTQPLVRLRSLLLDLGDITDLKK